jgi:hypothetical protein
MLALVSTGITSGLVTVALKNWQSICWPLFRKSSTPSRGGSVRFGAFTTRVFVPQKSSFFQANPVVRAHPGVIPNAALRSERVRSTTFSASRSLFNGEDSGSPSFLFAAFSYSK